MLNPNAPQRSVVSLVLAILFAEGRRSILDSLTPTRLLAMYISSCTAVVWFSAAHSTRTATCKAQLAGRVSYSRPACTSRPVSVVVPAESLLSAVCITCACRYSWYCINEDFPLIIDRITDTVISCFLVFLVFFMRVFFCLFCLRLCSFVLFVFVPLFFSTSTSRSRTTSSSLSCRTSERTWPTSTARSWRSPSWASSPTA